MKNKLFKVRTYYMTLKIFSLIFLLMTISGCAVHKASFDCSNGKGMGCGSMLDVHKAIKDNTFRERTDSRVYDKSIKPCKNCQQLNSEKGEVIILKNSSYNDTSSAEEVTRSKEKVMRIWFNGYFDEHNNFHDSQYIYTIVEPSKWIVKG